MSKGGQKTTTTTNTALDPQSQAYVNAQRAQAQQGANVAQNLDPFTGPQTKSVAEQAAAFYNPYQQNVIDATGQQFDKLRAQATNNVAANATQAGAYGGTRQGVAAGVRQGQLDATQMGIVANLQQQGYQNALTQGTAYAEQQRQLQEQKNMTPLWQQQQAQQMLNMGMGPTSQNTTQTTTTPGKSLLGTVAGLGMTGLGIASGLGWAPLAAKAAQAA